MGELSGIEPPPDKKCSMAASSDCPGEPVGFFSQGLVVHREVASNASCCVHRTFVLFVVYMVFNVAVTPFYSVTKHPKKKTYQGFLPGAIFV